MKIKREDVIFDPTDPRAVALVGKEVWAFDSYDGSDAKKMVYIGTDGLKEFPFNFPNGMVCTFIAPIEEPKCIFTEGQRILVSDDGKDWRERTFVRYQEETNRMNFRVVLLGCEQQWHKTKSENLVRGYYYAKPLPEKKYRPFANAKEFAPHREKWLKSKDTSEIIRFESYDDTGVGDIFPWKELFKRYTFEDGTPCGVEVE